MKFKIKAKLLISVGFVEKADEKKIGLKIKKSLSKLGYEIITIEEKDTSVTKATLLINLETDLEDTEVPTSETIKYLVDEDLQDLDYDVYSISVEEILVSCFG